LHLRGEDHDAAAMLLAEHGLADEAFAILHIGKGTPLSLARYPIEPFVAIGCRLRDRFGLRVALTGSPAEREVVDAVVDRIGRGAATLAGKTPLRTLCGVINRAEIVVCPDSGPMHIAATLHVPVVGLFALRSDQPVRWRPLSPNSRVVRSPATRCPVGCTKERCRRFDCIEEIDVEAVTSAVADLLAAGLVAARMPR
jgi:ADP-heptose:LPS heptosyltransferase